MTGLEMKYFVLNPTQNDVYGVASRMALGTYAHVIQKNNSQLSQDIWDWLAEIYREIEDKDESSL